MAETTRLSLGRRLVWPRRQLTLLSRRDPVALLRAVESAVRARPSRWKAAAPNHFRCTLYFAGAKRGGQLVVDGQLAASTAGTRLQLTMGPGWLLVIVSGLAALCLPFVGLAAALHPDPRHPWYIGVLAMLVGPLAYGWNNWEHDRLAQSVEQQLRALG